MKYPEQLQPPRFWGLKSSMSVEVALMRGMCFKAEDVSPQELY